MANTKIPSELIADSSITAAKLADGTITTADIADSNVTTAKIADSNVTTAKIGDAQVTTAKITDANVTTGKIADDAVTTAKMASNSVTSDTIASGITLAGTTTLSSHLVMGDNDYIKLGDSSDLLITHDGSGSWIIDNGTGGLVLASDTLSIKNAAYNEQMISAVENGAVTLYYDNNIKFVTKADGVDITGELQADSLDIDGNADITGNLVVAGADHTFYSAAADIEFNIGRDATQKININVDDNNVKLIAQQDADGNSTHTYALDRYFAGTGANNFEIQKAGSMQFRIDTNGAATFTHDVNIAADDRALRIGAGADFALFHDAVDSTMRTSTGNLILSNTSQNNDILFKGSDSGTIITALTLDMSEAGAATFNSTISSGAITSTGNLLINESANTERSLRIQNSSATAYFGIEGSSANRFVGSSANNMFLGTTTADGIEFATANVVRATIDSSGNVGIATTSPTEKLHVSGGHIRINNGYELRTSDTSGNVKTITRVNSSNELEYGWSGAGPVKFMGGGSYTERMRIHTNANIGIGNTSPNSKLHIGTGTNSAVTVGSESTPAFQIGGTDNYRLGMYTDSEGGYIQNKNGDNGIIFRTKTAGEVMRLNAGTGVINAWKQINIHTNDSTTNDVVNSLMITNSSTGTTTTGFGGEIRFQAERNNGVIQNTGRIASVAEVNSGSNISSGLSFWTSAVGVIDEKVRISYDGKVGIGTGSPDNPLDIMKSDSGYAQIRIGTNKTDNTNKTAGIISTTYTNQSVSMFQMFNQNGSNAIYYGSADGAHRGIQTHYFYVNTNYNSTSGHSLALTINSSGLVSGDLNDTSDIGFKENIQDLESALDKVKLLKPRTFTWKGHKQAAGNSVGFVAQEVETVITDDTIVKGNNYNEETSELIGKSLNTIGLVSYLTKAIQEQQTIIDDLKSRIETLEG